MKWTRERQRTSSTGCPASLPACSSREAPRSWLTSGRKPIGWCRYAARGSPILGNSASEIFFYLSEIFPYLSEGFFYYSEGFYSTRQKKEATDKNRLKRTNYDRRQKLREGGARHALLSHRYPQGSAQPAGEIDQPVPRAQAEPLFGQCLSIGSPLANQLQQLENKIEEGIEIGEKTLLCINRPIESADLRIEDFVGISFTHHMEILHKTTTLDERIYYIHQVNLYHWNKYVLRKYLSDDLYHHQGNMPNNFPKAIPDIKQSMKTISMFKDESLVSR